MAKPKSRPPKKRTPAKPVPAPPKNKVVDRDSSVSFNDHNIARSLKNTPNSYYNRIQPSFPATPQNHLPKTAYFDGGAYNSLNRCSFSYFDESLPPSNPSRNKSIALLVPPTGISWEYKLRTRIIDTYGGQVVQILGVEIDNFKLTGYIPSGFWGKYKQAGTNYLLDNYQADLGDYEKTVISDSQEKINRNGLVNLGNFFKHYFTMKTQTRYSTSNMVFSYPHYGWTAGGEGSIYLIPKEFPRIRISNEEILPQWELNCSLVEYMSSHFISNVTAVAKKQLGQLKGGIGFAEFIKWSDPTASGIVDPSAAAKSLGESYKNYITNFSSTEAEALASEGFSYPKELLKSSDKSIKTTSQIIQDRFSSYVR
jgi:hypothetical protein